MAWIMAWFGASNFFSGGAAKDNGDAVYGGAAGAGCASSTARADAAAPRLEPERSLGLAASPTKRRVLQAGDAPQAARLSTHDAR